VARESGFAGAWLQISEYKAFVSRETLEQRSMSTVSQPRLQGALAPAEPIPDLPGCNMGQFRSWAYSNLLENAVRPAFGEFVVGTP
jgi:hypothetical protein